MDRIATEPAADRRDLFSETANRLEMNPAIVEKDFWVCWILKQLFAEPILKDQMVFKGGTSLSNVFGSSRGWKCDLACTRSIVSRSG
jgi:predicted nucleotidyltransferase component of viral defense system